MRAVKIVERGSLSDGAAGQFDLVVERGSQSVRFTVRPICSSATTNVTVEPSRNLSYYVTYCEGNPATGVATTGAAWCNTERLYAARHAPRSAFAR